MNALRQISLQSEFLLKDEFVLGFSRQVKTKTGPGPHKPPPIGYHNQTPSPRSSPDTPYHTDHPQLHGDISWPMATLPARNDHRIILHLVNSPSHDTSQRGTKNQSLTQPGLRLLLRLSF